MLFSAMNEYKEDFFIFTIKTDENLTKNISNFAKICNPEKILYCICFKINDFSCSIKNKTTDYIKLQKVYCFITFYPFFMFFFSLLVKILSKNNSNIIIKPKKINNRFY